MNEILVIDDNLDIRVLISGILKDKGYFIDVKGARPFFEVTKDDLRKAVSGLGKKDQLKYCSLLSRGGLPGDCAAAIDDNPVKAAQVFEHLSSQIAALHAPMRSWLADDDYALVAVNLLIIEERTNACASMLKRKLEQHTQVQPCPPHCQSKKC